MAIQRNPTLLRIIISIDRPGEWSLILVGSGGEGIKVDPSPSKSRRKRAKKYDSLVNVMVIVGVEEVVEYFVVYDRS